MAAKVAIITGGASGMGLATVKRLVKIGWNVAIVDFDKDKGTAAAAQLGDQAIFIHTNVARYEDQVSAFRQVWGKWGHIDLVWANAGITDRTNFFEVQAELDNGGPPRPDDLVMKVCLDGVVWTSYVALHYFRKNASKGGKLIFTASEAAIYPLPELPIYTAAKTGVIGLARSMGQKLKELGEPITVNAICPGLVPTGLNLGNPLMDVTPKEFFTPQATIVRAVERIIEDDSLTAQILECSVEDIVARPVLPYLNAAAEFIGAGKFKELISHEATSEFSAKQGKELTAMEI